MTTKIHECHPRDTKEQLHDVRLHDVELPLHTGLVCTSFGSFYITNYMMSQIHALQMFVM